MKSKLFILVFFICQGFVFGQKSIKQDSATIIIVNESKAKFGFYLTEKKEQLVLGQNLKPGEESAKFKIPFTETFKVNRDFKCAITIYVANKYNGKCSLDSINYIVKSDEIEIMRGQLVYKYFAYYNKEDKRFVIKTIPSNPY